MPSKFAAIAALAISVSMVAGPSRAIDLSDDPVEKGRQIATETENRDAGFGDSQAIMKMFLENAYGETSERELRQKTLEVVDPNTGDKSMIVFDLPRDIEGTSLLTHAKILDPDDQWIWLPSIKRIKRITSANKSGPFMGSEFAYEDFSAQELGKYDYKWLRDEACPDPVADRTCHVIERTPLYENSGYTLQTSWVDTVDYQPRKLDYYNRGGDLMKTLLMTEYRLYLDKHWRAHDLFMTNHISGKKTRLVWEEFEIQTGLDDGDFSQASLRRSR